LACEHSSNISRAPAHFAFIRELAGVDSAEALMRITFVPSQALLYLRLQMPDRVRSEWPEAAARSIKIVNAY